MEFYEMLNNYYDEIFPFSESTYSFIKDQSPENAHLLEIGSATGKYIKTFQTDGFKATGLEYSKIFMNDPYEMVIGDMHKLPFKKESFETVFCIGNTLAHSVDRNEVHKVLYSAFSLLKPKGSLVVQTVNYDRICANGIKELDPIETPNVKFERYYEYADDERVLFKGVLTDKKNNKKQSSEVNLVPVFYEDFIKASSRTGSSFVCFNGDFDYGKFYKNESFMTVATFTKP
ncbi:MAG: class I SAM-dependent methyltransferase [Flexistipes sinusarabici]|uniref:Class I SAM-dependent methyltransferase n=1 Tax=Flexistipes sinusarabici TaxID=2352 RepID=A0A5D0MNX8_FLESI|nr:methyltransferase domain-containing protein [Flexistipes sinusarabici]TYB33191.1 MAG: class I SAM-dependent methyltransferase [Flexistipes sinusarabici]